MGASCQELIDAIREHRREVRDAGPVAVADAESKRRAAVKQEADRKLWALVPDE